MIRIQRASCPDVLEDAPQESKRYRNKAVVKALYRMQHEKCCYCEQPIPEEGHQKAVEHFKPQMGFAYLRNDWENLLLACPQCNGKKSSQFPVELTENQDDAKVIYTQADPDGRPLLLDPSDPDPQMDPENHIDFEVNEREEGLYGLPKEKNNSELGRTTIDVIGLDGSFHFGKRRYHLRWILLRVFWELLEALDAKDQDQIAVARSSLRRQMSAGMKYAAFARAFARYNKLHQPPFEVQIPAGAEV